MANKANPKALLLLSGGIDSPVAGKMAQEAGLDVSGLHFSFEPFTGNEAEEKCKKIAALLGFSALWVVKAGDEFSLLTKKCNHKYYFVLQKRLMLRAAELLACRESISFLVTGDNLGQVSSQTLSNLSTVDLAVSLPVLRPLLSFSKEEIMQKAREFGTLALSQGPEFCDILGPKKPATRSSPEKIQAEESSLPPGLASRLVEKAVCLSLG